MSKTYEEWEDLVFAKGLSEEETLELFAAWRRQKEEIKHLERRCSLLDRPPLTSTMVAWAFRYCLGRSTYVVQDCVSYLLEHWKLLEDHTKENIYGDIKEAFRTNNYGMEQDKRHWSRILRRREEELNEQGT